MMPTIASIYLGAFSAAPKTGLSGAAPHPSNPLRTSTQEFCLQQNSGSQCRNAAMTQTPEKDLRLAKNRVILSI
jgi:hypothetical protein